MEKFNGGEKRENKGALKHGLLMILCCMLPILIVAVLSLSGKGGKLGSLAFLLCPLMHIGMMFMMRKSGHSGSCHGSSSENKTIGEK